MRSVRWWYAAPLAALLWTLSPTLSHAQAVNVSSAGVAANGYDLVAYVTDSMAQPGLAQITADHQGATYRFSTVGHRDTFVADPERYLPMYGGYCAYGVSRGHKVKTDPAAFRVVDGRLYLNYDKGVQKTWLKDIPGYVAKADSNWRQIKDAPRE